jgi:hypothetical protein
VRSTEHKAPCYAVFSLLSYNIKVPKNICSIPETPLKSKISIKAIDALFFSERLTEYYLLSLKIFV